MCSTISAHDFLGLRQLFISSPNIAVLTRGLRNVNHARIELRQDHWTIFVFRRDMHDQEKHFTPATLA
jgi:hypothetical protein